MDRERRNDKIITLRLPGVEPGLLLGSQLS